MIRALLYKELRHQLPFVILMLVLVVLSIAMVMATASLDQRGMAELVEDIFGFGAFAGIVNLIFCLALTSGLLVREFDEGTIEFIDALPVSRGALFATKAVVLAGILLSTNLLSLAWMYLVHLGSATSLDPSFHQAVILPAVLIDALMTLMGIDLGLLLSFSGSSRGSSPGCSSSQSRGPKSSFRHWACFLSAHPSRRSSKGSGESFRWHPC